MENSKTSIPNSDNETDILVLLEYFKKGVKKIFNGIGSLFSLFLKGFLWFLLLIKKHIIFISIIMILSAGYAIFKKDILPQNFTYELIVSPNYESTEALYNQVESVKSKMGNGNEFDFLKNINISPINTLKDKVDTYYTLNSDTEKDRDTLIYNQLKFKDYVEKIEDQNYATHKIVIRSSKKLSKFEINKLIIYPIEQNETFIRFKNANLKSININIDFLNKGIKRIDTLLAQVANERAYQTSNSISLKADAKNNIEEDLLNQYLNFTNLIVDLENKKANDSKIVNIISDGVQVENITLVPKNTFFYIFLGFIIAIILILLQRLWKYLSNLEKQKTV